LIKLAFRQASQFHLAALNLAAIEIVGVVPFALNNTFTNAGYCGNDRYFNAAFHAVMMAIGRPVPVFM
jgi:hypothetical protein